jgi:hypothetical protein
MQSGKPAPESRSDPLGTAELNAARGTLREALSGLRNFAELLHSVRVGSKALVSVLPDVAAGCAPMRATVDSLLSAVATRAGAAEATAALSDYFSPRLSLLDTELGAVRDRPLNAKVRLSLEQAITKLSLELDTARGLLDLLVDAVSNQSMRVDLAELVRQSFAGPPSGGSWNREHIVATMSIVQAEIEVELNPRIATALFALGVELVAHGDRGTPHVRVDQDGVGRHRVRIAPDNRRDGEDLILIARGVIEPTLTCLRAVALISGVSLLWDESAASVCFSFPELAKAQRKADEAG